MNREARIIMAIGTTFFGITGLRSNLGDVSGFCPNLEEGKNNIVFAPAVGEIVCNLQPRNPSNIMEATSCVQGNCYFKQTEVQE